MSTRNYLILWGIGAVILLLAAAFQPVPGYMDAEYYYAGGLRLAEGQGFTEPFLWNYLNDPDALPAPSHVYWMPLASILAAAGMGISGSTSYLAARILFLLLGSLLPPLTAWLSWRMTRRKRGAVLAGLLAAFSGFYTIYTGLVETFTPYLLFGGMFILLAGEKEWKWLKSGPVRFGLLGLLAGLMHMTRADGLLWLAAGVVLALVEGVRQSNLPKLHRLGRGVGLALICAAGYALVSGVWYARNVTLFHTMLPPGNGRAMWITNYDETFDFPAETLTAGHWLAAGLSTHLSSRWEALGANLSTTLAVQGEIYLLPLMLIGLWRLRKDERAQLGAGMWGATFLAMTIVFPFAGARGGFLHSGAAVQTLLWVAAPEGLLGVVEWAARRRKWKKKSAESVLGAMMVGLAALFTVGIFAVRVILPTEGGWMSSYERAVKVDAALTSFGAGTDRVVMINNPPGYYLANQHAAIVVPNGDISTLLEAGKRYGAEYVVLEKDVVRDLQDLYAHPADQPGLTYLGESDGAQFFRIEP